MRARLWMALLVTFAAYIACMSAGYIWDDEALILNNQALTHPTLRTLLGSDLWCCSGTTQSGYWRPLTTLSFYADVGLFGFNAAWAHLHSLGWHLLCTGLVGRLVAGRHGEVRGTIAALIFGVHPVLSEAVVWIAARNDLIATALGLAALLAVERDRPAQVALWALCAGLSKESSFLLPILVVAWTVAHDGVPGLRTRGRAILATGLGLGVAVGVRQFAVLGSMSDFHRVALGDPLAPVYGIARLLGWVSWPWPLTGMATLYLPAPGLAVWLPCALTLLGAGASVLVSPRRALGLLAFTVVAGAPMAAAIAVYATLGERYLYLPMVGVATLAATSVPLRRVTGLGLGMWAVGALTMLHLRLPDWVDPRAFFEAAVRSQQDSFSLNAYGQELAKEGQKREALDALERSLTAVPVRRFACASVPGVAGAVLDATGFREHLALWRSAGCDAISEFEPNAAWTLARLGDEEGALAMVDTMAAANGGVAAALQADVAARAGDIVLAAGIIACTDDVGDARARFDTLQILRSVPAGNGSAPSVGQ